MNNFVSRIILSLVFCFPALLMLGSTPSPATDSVKVSLLTCVAGEPIFTLFGHTAIRFQLPAQQMDIVYNYGLFDFNTPNFIWRFVRGETDYALGATTFERFGIGYYHENRAVWEQELNLTLSEKQKLLKLLQINNLPENRTYRYNFLYDNCSTRARDIIEKCVNGPVIYQEENYWQSFRDIVYQSTEGYDWSRFGMDFCLGVEADRKITFREETFAPFYLMEAFAKARVVSSGVEKQLVTDTKTIVTPKGNAQSGSYFITPWRAFLFLFIVSTALTICGLKKRKSLWWLDILLFAAAGLAGCVVMLLNFFSQHPAVSPNYLIFVFHPLHLLLLPFFIRKEMKGKRSIYHLLNATILTLFILLWPIIPQHFNLAVLPLALSLLFRSGSNLLLTYKPQKK